MSAEQNQSTTYYAENGYVWKSPVHKRHDDGTTTVTIGFRVCKMMPEVGDEQAHAVAQLMNAGDAVLQERQS